MTKTRLAIKHWPLLLLLLLSTLDGLITIRVCGLGWGREMNPIMSPLLAHSAWLFMLVKSALVLAGSIVLWKIWYMRAAKISCWICIAIYLAVDGWHLYNIFQIGLLEFFPA